MSANASSADGEASLKRKREEIASNATGDDDTENDEFPKPLDHFPEEVRAVIREKYTEIRSLSTVCKHFRVEENHDRFSEMMADTVRQAIEECPDIVRVGCPNQPSLLEMLCSLPSDEIEHTSQSYLFTDAIKVVIEKNPFALRWLDANFDGYENDEPENLFSSCIAYDYDHSRLLPWLVQNYGHILCSGYLQYEPLHFDLVNSYAKGFCDRTTVRLFYETYPNSLKDLTKRISHRAVEEAIAEYDPLNPQFEDTGQRFPLHHAILEEQPDQEDYDLFEWMIEQNPEALQNQDPLGQTILHQIFLTFQGDQRVFSGYAHLVINASPAIVFVKDKKGKYAAQYLSNRAAHGNGYPWLDDEMLVRLLRRMFAAELIDDELRADPFIAGIEKLLEKQYQLSMNSVQIRRVEMMINKAIAVKSGDTSVLSEVKEVYGDWSKKHLPAMKEAIIISTAEDIPRVHSETRGVQNESPEEDEDSSGESSSSDDEGEN